MNAPNPCNDHSPTLPRQRWCEADDCPNRAESIVEGLCDVHFKEWVADQRRLEESLPEPTPTRVARLAGGFALGLAGILSLLWVTP